MGQRSGFSKREKKKKKKKSDTPVQQSTSVYAPPSVSILPKGKQKTE